MIMARDGFGPRRRMLTKRYCVMDLIGFAIAIALGVWWFSYGCHRLWH